MMCRYRRLRSISASVNHARARESPVQELLGHVLVGAVLGNWQNYPAATDHAAGQPGSRCWVAVTRGIPA